MLMRSRMPLAAGVESVRFAFSARNHGWWPPPRPEEPAGPEAEEPGEATDRPGKVRDPAAVGMIRLAGLAGLAAAMLAEEIQTLDENPGVRWAPPEDTPGRIGPFNPGVRRDRSGP
jgi:hypothetical protein